MKYLMNHANFSKFAGNAVTHPKMLLPLDPSWVGRGWSISPSWKIADSYFKAPISVWIATADKDLSHFFPLMNLLLPLDLNNNAFSSVQKSIKLQKISFHISCYYDILAEINKTLKQLLKNEAFRNRKSSFMKAPQGHTVMTLNWDLLLTHNGWNVKNRYSLHYMQKIFSKWSTPYRKRRWKSHRRIVKCNYGTCLLVLMVV